MSAALALEYKPPCTYLGASSCQRGNATTPSKRKKSTNVGGAKIEMDPYST